MCAGQVVPASPPQLMAQALPAEPLACPSFNLLIVDDSELIRTRLISLLDRVAGIASIDQAATLAHAMERVRYQPPDLVILDLHLPDGLGTEIIGSLKQMAPNLRIAVLTFCGEDAYRKQCLALGADWFFDKASEFDALLALVHDQIEQNQPEPGTRAKS